MIPRPADQRFSFSLLFQDEMPRNPDYKVLLSLFFGSGCRTDRRPSTATKTSCARRLTAVWTWVFSRVMFSDDDKRSGLVSLEVFNLLGINNTINHNWIQDVNGRFYAVPNFLTGRRLNLKVSPVLLTGTYPQSTVNNLVLNRCLACIIPVAWHYADS